MDKEENSIDMSDGGYGSRKLLYSLGSSMLIFGGGFIAAYWPKFGAGYATMCTGLTGVLALYLGANVGHKYVTGKAQTSSDLIDKIQ